MNYYIKNSTIDVINGGKGYEPFDSLNAPYLEFLPFDELDEQPNITINIDNNTGAITSVDCLFGAFNKTPIIKVSTKKVTNTSDIINKLSDLNTELYNNEIIDSLKIFLQTNVVTDSQMVAISSVIAQLST